MSRAQSVTNLQALARLEGAETSRVFVRRILKLDVSSLPLCGERYVLPTGPMVEIVAITEDDMEVRCRYIVNGIPGHDPGDVVGFTLSWLRKHGAPVCGFAAENPA